MRAIRLLRRVSAYGEGAVRRLQRIAITRARHRLFAAALVLERIPILPRQLLRLLVLAQSRNDCIATGTLRRVSSSTIK